MNEHAIIRHSNKLNTHAYKQHKQTNQNIKEKKGNNLSKEETWNLKVGNVTRIWTYIKGKVGNIKQTTSSK